ncbi:MAG: hypothetical protein ACON34_11095 [Flavobacteriales bacterium]
MAGPTTFLDRTSALPFTGAELCMEFREGGILHLYNIDSRSNLLGIPPSSAVGVPLEELDLELGLLRLATQAFKQAGLTAATVSYTVKLPHLSEGHEVMVRVVPMRQEGNLDMHYLVVNHVRTVKRPQSEHAPDWVSIYGQSNDVVFVLNQHYRVEFANAHEGTSFPGVELGSKLIQALEPESRALFALSLERSLHEFRALQFKLHAHRWSGAPLVLSQHQSGAHGARSLLGGGLARQWLGHGPEQARKRLVGTLPTHPPKCARQGARHGTHS